MEDAKRLWQGVAEIADDFELALVGGDTTRWDHPLVIDVAIVATCYPGIKPVQRDGAKLGDTVYVTGLLGGSGLGKHMAFVPRVAEAKALAIRLSGQLHAMMDISDGLSLDLWRMCQASNAGVCLEEAALERVASADARRAADRDGRTVLEHVLSDGEDFELLIASGAVLNETDVPLYAVGTITESGFNLRHKDGHVVPLKPQGFTH